MKLLQTTKDFIKNHANKIYPKECCGFVVKDKLGNLDHIEAENISDNNIEFCIDPYYFLVIQDNYSIDYVYHSHPDKNYTDFSEADIICAKNLMKNLILYIVELNIFKIYDYRTGEVSHG